MILLAWVTFPGGGVYPWVWIPAACAAIVLTLAVRPALGGPGFRALDAALVAVMAAIAVQLVPLPSSILRVIDPHAIPLRSAMWLLPPADVANASLPISIVALHTAAALGIVTASVLLYWTSRRICENGGAGRIVRGIAWIGLIASIAAIVQRSQSQQLLYGIFRPIDAGARPYGPFVNRNHFGTWMIMACPLVFGYLLARAPSSGRSGRVAQRVASSLRQLGSMRVWLITAVCVMTLAVLLSASRSGVIGLIAAFAGSVILATGSRDPRVARWTIFQGVLLVIVAVWFANFDLLVARIDETLVTVDAGRGRGAIWADARRIIRDFGATGTGAGTFGTAIAVYQTAEPGYSIGHAHNHFLQLAAEGGALVSMPAALTAGAFFMLFSSRLRDGSERCLRAGAAAGMIGVLVQSLWETGLRMPANAMLFAVLAAIATHAPARRVD